MATIRIGEWASDWFQISSGLKAQFLVSDMGHYDETTGEYSFNEFEDTYSDNTSLFGISVRFVGEPAFSFEKRTDEDDLLRNVRLTIESCDANGNVFATKQIIDYDNTILKTFERYDYDYGEFNNGFDIATLAGYTIDTDEISTYTEEDGVVNLVHSVNGTLSLKLNFYCYSNCYFDDVYTPTINLDYTVTDIHPHRRTVTFVNADNFTDESNPTISYYNPAGGYIGDLQAAISLTDETNPIIAFRSISPTAVGYTFNLTNAERNALRAAITTSITTPIKFYLKTIYPGYEDKPLYDSIERNLTIVGAEPLIANIVIFDANEETVALTGDQNTIVKYESNVEFSFDAIPSKSASIVDISIQCGERIISGMTQGIIDDPESGDFVITLLDSRGLITSTTVAKEFVEYVKPTCYQKTAIEITGETGATIGITISGSYFAGNFGTAGNPIKIELRHTQNDGTMGEWVDLTDGLVPFIDYERNTYSLTLSISGFSYTQIYDFQSRITDQFYTVISATNTVEMLPVFDWGESDFNFNVPVRMNQQTVLRHNATANNTVLSASGGHIYLRPGGTDATTGEVKITPAGNMELSGDLIIDGTSLLTILKNAGLI